MTFPMILALIVAVGVVAWLLFCMVMFVVLVVKGELPDEGDPWVATAIFGALAWIVVILGLLVLTVFGIGQWIESVR